MHELEHQLSHRQVWCSNVNKLHRWLCSRLPFKPHCQSCSFLVLCCRVSGLDDEAFGALHNTIRRGDLVGVKGLPGKSKRGELSVFPQSFIVLAPCLHMLPKYKLENQVRSFTNAPMLCCCCFFVASLMRLNLDTMPACVHDQCETGEPGQKVIPELPQ